MSEEIEEKRTKKALIRLLSKKAWFSHSLFQNLLRKGHQPKTIQKLIAQAKLAGYLNDEELALRYVGNLEQRGYGRRYIEQKLRVKAGNLQLPISKQIDPIENIVKLIERRYLKFLDAKEPQKSNKLVGALVRKGFELEDIFAALRQLKQDPE